MMLRKSFLATTALGAGVLIAALAAPAFAADQTPTPPTDQPQSGAPPTTPPTSSGATSTAPTSTQVNEIVVTGSRIKTTTYTSPAPMTVITAEQAQLQGAVDTSQILQLSTVAANAVQINNYFTG
ncbi:MAG TPA: hypothetical protein VMU37_00700, partial [Caulobacteraceae bacterium]|nr:hypothetical protein [Caulobacteraceae bacterium]